MTLPRRGRMTGIGLRLPPLGLAFATDMDRHRAYERIRGRARTLLPGLPPGLVARLVLAALDVQASGGILPT